MRIDIRRLKAELRMTAGLCREARITYQDSQRPPTEGKIPAWKASMTRDQMSWHMTKLCIFRAHLRGVKHIQKSSMEIDEAAIIETMERDFALKE